jgi:tyrosyl-tRNA synthetase
LDEEYLKVDAQFGGVDQRKIFMYAQEYLPLLGYEKRAHLLNPLIPGLGKDGKMSASDPSSKIDLDDSPETIAEKVNKAYSVDGEVEGNGLLAITRYILFKWLEQEGRELHVERPEKWGGNVSYSEYEDLERDFVSKKLSSIDLKSAVARELTLLLAPIKERMDRERELLERAYNK